MSLRTTMTGYQWWVLERAVSRRIEEVLVKAEVDTTRVPALLCLEPQLRSDGGPNAENR